MKKTIKIFSALLAIVIFAQCTLVVSASSANPYTGFTYTHQSRFAGSEKLNGIDVSDYNENINWSKVKADGIDYAFVRVGYTGYTRSKHSLNYDSYYKTNITGAYNAGIKVGVYWYSQALTTAEAQAEAEKVLTAISPYKSKITMPVVFDYEFASVSNGRLDYGWSSGSLNKTKMTNNALAFCSSVKSAGYTPCVYANKSFLTSQLNASSISALYPIWLAHYTTNTDYKGEFDYWQYSSSGNVDGINGKTDVNFIYRDVIKLSSQTYTGSAIKPTPTITDLGGNKLTKDTDYTLSYSNNVNVGTATIVAKGKNQYSYINNRYSFNIIPQQVTGLTLVSRTQTSLTYKWNSVKGANMYKVSVYNNTQKSSFVKRTSSTTITLSNLTNTNYYEVKVAGYKENTDCQGKYSSVNAKHTMPGQATGLTSSSPTNTTFYLKWSKKAGATGYYLYKYSPSTKTYKQIATLKGDSATSFKITNAKPGTYYYYAVSAYISDSTVKIGAKTPVLQATTTPAKSTLTSISASSSRKINLKWSKVSCTGYQIQYSTKSNFSSDKKTIYIGGSKTATTFTVPTKGKKYYVRIRPYKSPNGTKVYGSYSNVKSITSK